MYEKCNTWKNTCKICIKIYVKLKTTKRMNYIFFVVALFVNFFFHFKNNIYFCLLLNLIEFNFFFI